MGKKAFYALTIGLNRGLFIVTNDGKMLKRIFGPPSSAIILCQTRLN